MYFIKREECTRKLATVCHCNSHTIVDLHLHQHPMFREKPIFSLQWSYPDRCHIRGSPNFRINQYLSCFPTSTKANSELGRCGETHHLSLLFRHLEVLLKACSLLLSLDDID